MLLEPTISLSIGANVPFIKKLITLYIFTFAGKKRDEIENFLNEGIYEVNRLKENGWITDISYEDQV